MRINFKKLIFYIIITFIIGNIFTLFINTELYNNINKGIDIPGIVFPIVWSILFLLMAISAYIISESNNLNKISALKSYFIQLIFNSLWTLIFFGLRTYTLSFVWIIVLILLVINMITKFYNIKKIAGLINIPYIIWLLFAAYLNLSIIILN